MRMRHLSGSILAALAAFGVSASPCALATTNSVPTGYYVGMGDGALIVFHALPGGKATIGVVEMPTGGGWRPTPTTATVVIAAAQTSQGAHMGTLQPTDPSHPGHYLFVLGSPAQKLSYCIHSVTMTSDGALLIQQPKFQTGCMNYHGATWGFSAPSASPLKPYPVPRG